MSEWVTRQHLGLLLTVAGTVWLAFSVSVRHQYVGDMRSVAEKSKGSQLIEPTEARISPMRFWVGLLFVAIGALLQW